MKGDALPSKHSRFRHSFFLFAVALGMLPAHGLDAPDPGRPVPYARKNSFGVGAAYSPDSSHILLGVAERRKLVDVGLSYGRQLHSGATVNWVYEGEFSPLTFVGDPRLREIITETAPVPNTFVIEAGRALGCTPFQESYTFKDQYGVVHAETVAGFCHGRQWTAGQALLPIGMRWSFLPRHKLQPEFTAHVGYMFSTRPVPVEGSGAFNFVFDFGPGVELYRSHSRSVRLEYRFHHISNHDSAAVNPGIDNGVFRLSYIFGR
jgi:hypothetical protein